MQEIAVFAGITGALAVGMVSPGPRFVMVARLAGATSRANGLGAAVGIGGVLLSAVGLHELAKVIRSLSLGNL